MAHFAKDSFVEDLLSAYVRTLGTGEVISRFLQTDAPVL
jgi:hypothetical protein